MSGHLFDRRRLPLFIHSELDDMGLSPEAFRVYAHLARRAGKDGRAWPGVQSIGDVCFPGLKHPDSRRKYTSRALAELEQMGLISRVARFGKDNRQLSNDYVLLPVLELSDGGDHIARGEGDHIAPPRGTVEPPKDSPVEGTVNNKLTPSWRECLMPVLLGHTDWGLVLKKDWGILKQVATKLQQAGRTPDDVLTWRTSVWDQAWPGNTGQLPTPSQLLKGMGQMGQAKAKPTHKLVVVAKEEDE